jgi:hypothetical protein
VRAPAVGDVLHEPVQPVVGRVRIVVAAQEQQPGGDRDGSHRDQRGKQAPPAQARGSGTPPV